MEFKTHIKRLVVEKFDLKDVHWLATYLDPGYKHFGFIKNDIVRKSMLEKTRSLLVAKIADIQLPVPDAGIVTDASQREGCSAAKKRKLDIFDAARIGVPQIVENMSEIAELDHYETAPVPESKNPLEFWKRHQNDLPRLAKVAAQVLVISASSAPSERCFSAAGRIIEERRTSLKPETVDDLVRVRSFLLNKEINQSIFC